MATAATKLGAQPQALADLFRSPEKRRVVGSLLLVLLTLLLYDPVARNGFVNYDDPDYITGNTHVQSGLSWDTIRWAFTSTEQANWHPLTWISHAVDYQLFHLKPAGHHYTNVLLHAIAAILLFLFLEAATGLAGRSLVVASLFVVHPLNVESVAWASERKNVLCTVFFMLGLWAYRRYALKPSIKRYFVVAVMFALGLMAKPMVITFPFVLLLLDYWPLERMSFSSAGREQRSGDYARRSVGQLVTEKLPLFGLSAASAVITMIAQKGGGALREEYSFSARLANALVAYVSYIGKTIWPSNLAPLYPFPRTGLPAWQVLGSIAVLLLITLGVWKMKRHRYLTVGWLWFLGTLVPMIGLVQVGEQAMADRYVYISAIGLFIAITWGVVDWSASRQLAPTYGGVAALAVLVAFCGVTHIQIGYWQNGLSLWSHALAVTRDNFVAEDNLGAALITEGNFADAKTHFQSAIEINPQDAFSQIDIGVCDKKLGDTQGALEHYKTALQLTSNPSLRATALANLGSLYRAAGDYPAAEQNYAGALGIQPANSLALFGMGLIAQKAGHYSQAADYYRQAVRSAPSDVGYLLLAQVLDKDGHPGEAQAAMEQAKRTSQDMAAAQQAVERLLRE